MSNKHSHYNISATARLLKCAASFDLGANMPREESEYAAEGTRAHAVCEQAVLTGEIPADVDTETRECAQVYLDEINQWRSHYTVIEEHTERFLESAEIPKFGGTSDHCILAIDPNGKVVLHVFDYKHGVGIPVAVEDNKQLMSYAIVIAEFTSTAIDYFRLTIVQPRSPSQDAVQSWEFGLPHAVAHKRAIIAAIERQDMAMGDHCSWCPALRICPLQKARALELAQRVFGEDVPHNLSPAELELLFTQRSAIRSYLDHLEDLILGEMAKGVEFEGLKAVSKQSARKWVLSEEETLKKLKSRGVKMRDAKVEKLRTPTQLITAGYGAKIEDLAEREDQGYKVVPVTARGEQVDLVSTKFEVFED